MTSRVRWVREKHGDEGLRRLKAALSPEHRTRLEQRILPHEWVPFDLFVELNVKADALFGTGDLAVVEQMARYGAEVNLPTLYRIFYKLGTPEFILGKAARLWEVHYTSGRLEVEKLEAGGGRLLLRDFETPHPAHCRSVLGWAVRSVELSGGEVLSYGETECRTHGDERCVFEVRWRR
ncbi:MAG: hypothetical protein RMK74_14015 [Myxococcales bacterium]|nr:hypothetical protein [Myxococcales bacterium]